MNTFTIYWLICFFGTLTYYALRVEYRNRTESIYWLFFSVAGFALFPMLIIIEVNKYRQRRRRETMRFRKINFLNDTKGGDWYYDHQQGCYKDSLTDRSTSRVDY